jgi:outer membrane protein assembly factor BamB
MKARLSFTMACCSSTPLATKVQALDAVTGDLLVAVLPPSADGSHARRASARSRLYGDKVYTGTSDVHLVALDARTGRVIWDKEVADRTKGFSLSGGVTVAKGKVIASTTGPQQLAAISSWPSMPTRGGGVALQHHSKGERTRRQYLEWCAV